MIEPNLIADFLRFHKKNAKLSAEIRYFLCPPQERNMNITEIFDYLSEDTAKLVMSASNSVSESVIYGIIEERYILSNDARVSYGIAAFADAESDGTATIIASVHDISSDITCIINLVNDCNKALVSPVFLRNIVEDFLGR